MDLIKQFPDISMKIREKVDKKRIRAQQISSWRQTNQPERKRAELYERSFRRWHAQLLMIIIILLAGIYLIVLNSPWMSHLINSLTVNAIR